MTQPKDNKEIIEKILEVARQYNHVGHEDDCDLLNGKKVCTCPWKEYEDDLTKGILEALQAKDKAHQAQLKELRELLPMEKEINESTLFRSEEFILGYKKHEKECEPVRKKLKELIH